MLVVVNNFFSTLKRVSALSRLHINKSLKDLTEQEFVYFTKGDNISVLNRVMMYVQENEITKKVKIVSILNDTYTLPATFMSDLEVLDRVYPEIKIEFIRMEGAFGPKIIEELSKKWNIPINFMFIGSPSHLFAHEVSELGGVRLII